MYSSLDDARLMALIQSGNHDAFTELVKRYTHTFFALALRTLHQSHEAEDAVQSAFIKLWQKPHAWDPQKNTQFTTWFYRVVLNHCHDMQRKNKSMIYQDFTTMAAYYDQQDNVGFVSQQPSLQQSEQDSLEVSQQQRWQQYCIEYAIAQLPSSQKDALNLVLYCGLPQQQAAQVLGVSIKALEALLFRARKNVKRSCEELISEQTPVPKKKARG